MLFALFGLNDYASVLWDKLTAIREKVWTRTDKVMEWVEKSNEKRLSAKKL